MRLKHDLFQSRKKDLTRLFNNEKRGKGEPVGLVRRVNVYKGKSPDQVLRKCISRPLHALFTKQTVHGKSRDFKVPLLGVLHQGRGGGYTHAHTRQCRASEEGRCWEKLVQRERAQASLEEGTHTGALASGKVRPTVSYTEELRQRPSSRWASG